MSRDNNNSQMPAAAATILPCLPVQAEPVSRRIVGAAISGDAGLEASDYNDPVYFFLNWPASV